MVVVVVSAVQVLVEASSLPSGASGLTTKPSKGEDDNEDEADEEQEEHDANVGTVQESSS